MTDKPLRDRDAIRVAAELARLSGLLADLLPRARKKLREYQSEGYPNGTGGGSSIGSDRHSDPVARAVENTQKLDQAGNVIDETALDEFGDRLTNVDKRLRKAYRLVFDLAEELAGVTQVTDKPGEDGCALCNAARQPAISATTGKPHDCDQACRERDHRHPLSHQPIYSRRAPKPEHEDIPRVADMPRCTWHYEFAERYGADAHPEIVLYHLDHPGAGRGTPRPLLLAFHSQELARLQRLRRQPA